MSYKFNIIAIGKMTGHPHEKAIMDEYLKRMPFKIKVIEIPNVKYGTSPIIKAQEAEAINKFINKDYFNLILDETGKQCNSIEFANYLNQWLTGHKGINCIIGGAYGLSQNILDQANFILSLGKMTWPHMLVRAMLTEQIYRAYTINNHQPYHKK